VATGRILAVDDDRFFREFYADVLGREGYQVDTVADAKTCLERIEQNPYDLAILDLILDDMSGIELARRIRESNRGLELIMATKVDDMASINRALAMGIREYILKPVNEAELVQTVGKILERQRVFFEHGKLLAERVEYVYTLSIYKRCLAILGALELAPLVELVLEACMQECEAAGAIAWLRVDGEPSLYREFGRRGLVDERELKEFSYSEYEHHEQVLNGLPFFPHAAGREGGPVDRDAIHVPLIRDKELLGILKLSRKVDGKFRAKDLQTLRMLGEFTSIALFNALTVRELKQRLSRGENFILTPERFAALVERERATALRYNRTFSLVEIELPDARREVEGFLQEVLRDSDAVTRLPRGAFRFFLSETDGIGARSFGRRLTAGLRAKGYLAPGAQAVPFHAAFPADGENEADLEGALRRRREASAASLAPRLKPGDFSARFQELIAGQGREGLFDKNAFIDAVQFLLADIEADPRRRTALFLGLGKLAPYRAWLDDRLHGLGKQARVSIFGDTGDLRLPENLDNVAAIHVPVGQGPESYFALYLTPDKGYVLLFQKDGAKKRVFQTADEYLADTLILAVQEQYFLQRQL
jgi:CheY-like chemotaxis protein